MRFLVFLSFVSVIRSTAATPLLGNSDDTNLFLDPNADPLFSDNVNGLAANHADPTLDQVSLADGDSNTFDWTDSVELAGVDNFCAADEEIQTIGKMRARDDRSSCSSSGQNVNLLKLPNPLDLFRKGKQPLTQPGPETENAVPSGPLTAPEENQCQAPYTEHLCCAEPAPNSLHIVNGKQFRNTMVGCEYGTYPDRKSSLYLLRIIGFDSDLRRSPSYWNMSESMGSLLQFILCMKYLLLPPLAGKFSNSV